MTEECVDFSYRSSRFEYDTLMDPHIDNDTLKERIVKAVWNDDRLLRQDIKDIANDLLEELHRG